MSDFIFYNQQNRNLDQIHRKIESLKMYDYYCNSQFVNNVLDSNRFLIRLRTMKIDYCIQMNEQPNSRLSSRMISTPFKNSPKERQAK